METITEETEFFIKVTHELKQTDASMTYDIPVKGKIPFSSPKDANISLEILSTEDEHFPVILRVESNWKYKIGKKRREAFASCILDRRPIYPDSEE